MYKYQEHQMIMPEDFFLPFGGSLNKENRWVKLAQIIPWWKVEEHYAATFKKATAKGTQPFSARLALGALIIQQRQGFSDRETVLEITENPYMQYFLGLPAFHYSMMPRFRKRLKKRDIEQINEWLVLQDQPAAKEAGKKKQPPNHQGPKSPAAPSGKSEPPAPSDAQSENQGKLILDAPVLRRISPIPPMFPCWIRPGGSWKK